MESPFSRPNLRFYPDNDNYHDSNIRLNQTKPNMKIFVAGLSYKTTSVEVREKLAVQRSRLPCCGCRLKLRAGLDEVVVLSTCNRVEIYGVSPWIHGRVYQLFRELTGGDFDFTSHLYV